MNSAPYRVEQSRCTTIAAAVAISAFILIGCDRQPNVEKTGADLDKLYAVYLSSDADAARQSLIDSLTTIATSNLAPSNRAALLHHTFARLFVLESRLGNSRVAEAHAVKMKYWYLKRSEMSGVARPDNVILDVPSSMNDAAKLSDVSEAKMIEFVDTWDLKKNNQQPPRYYAAIQKNGVSP